MGCRVQGAGCRVAGVQGGRCAGTWGVGCRGCRDLMASPRRRRREGQARGAPTNNGELERRLGGSVDMKGGFVASSRVDEA